MKMLIKIKGIFFSFLISVTNNFSFAQSSKYIIDSMTLNISYDDNLNILNVFFINQSNSIVILPWQEQLPYVSFDEDSIGFTIYLANENGFNILSDQKNTPLYTFENNQIEIRPKGTIKKTIELEDMITKNEIKNRDNLYMFAKYFIRKCENSTIKEYYIISNKVILY